MKLYSAIDLHSTNCVIGVINEEDKTVYKEKIVNDLGLILKALEPYREQMIGVAVESTYNWYWLVDGLMGAGFKTHLVNTAAVKQYEGLKHTDDQYDAYYLAHLLRLGILPVGYIYPKEERTIRDLLRKRAYLVRQRTANLTSLQCFYSRHTGKRLTGNQAKDLTEVELREQFSNPNTVLEATANIVLNQALEQQIIQLEKAILSQTKDRPEFKYLTTVSGIGKILALTILLETGDINRFGSVGQYASYCRCVNSNKISNGRKKGTGNVKNGNKYLAWAFAEAANFSIRFNEKAKKFYQRKMAKRCQALAFKALAHKLARACYYIMKESIPFNEEMLFG